MLLSGALRRVKKATELAAARRAFRAEFKRLKQSDDARLPMIWDERWPILPHDALNAPSPTDYLLHVGWAARRLAESAPAAHVDFSSTAFFAAITSAFIPVEYFEFRPTSLPLSGLKVGQADLCALQFPDDSLESVSCMHVVEHIGLGRYGDPIDAGGDLRAMRELARVTAPSGRLLFVVPVGRPRIVFNAHRIYGFSHIVTSFPSMFLESHALITDGGAAIIEGAPEREFDAQGYGCGCFEFVKKG